MQDQKPCETVAEAVKRHGEALTRYLCAQVGNYADAEDLSQETFLRLSERWDKMKFDVDGQLRSWLFRTGGNLSLNWSRFNGRRRTSSIEEAATALPNSSPPIVDAAARRELCFRLSVCVNQLDKRKKEVVQKKINGATFEEIGDAFGLSTSRARQLYEAALSEVTICLATGDFPSP